MAASHWQAVLFRYTSPTHKSDLQGVAEFAYASSLIKLFRSEDNEYLPPDKGVCFEIYEARLQSKHQVPPCRKAVHGV